MKKYFNRLAITFTLVVGTFVGLMFTSVRPLLGLDLQGGFSVILESKNETSKESLDTAVDIIRQRVDSLGVAEPEISRQGDTIVVDLPGIKDRSKAEQVIGQTAELRFREVMLQGDIQSKDKEPKDKTTTSASAEATTTTVAAATPGKSRPGFNTAEGDEGVPTTGGADPIVVDASDTNAVDPAAANKSDASSQPTCSGKPATVSQDFIEGKVTAQDKNTAELPVSLLDKDKKTIYALCPAILKGDIVDTATSHISGNGSGYVVTLDLTSKGAALFQQLVATPLVNRSLAIELDGVVQSAPVINAGITGSSLQISGDFDQEEVDNLSTILNFGSLPVALKQQAARSISPTLGKDQLKAGIVAGVIGVILVMLYMFLYYRIMALVVLVGLSLTGLSIFTIVSLLSDRAGLTLSLSGAVGLIVSLGVTVDSYIVYFEKIKDVATQNNNIKLSSERAYKPALRTILAADFVSLLGAIVLYLLATGNVRGFAFFLGLSTVLDLVISIAFMHPLVMILASSKKLTNMRFFGIRSGLDIPTVKPELKEAN